MGESERACVCVCVCVCVWQREWPLPLSSYYFFRSSFSLSIFHLSLHVPPFNLPCRQSLFLASLFHYFCVAFEYNDYVRSVDGSAFHSIQVCTIDVFVCLFVCLSVCVCVCVILVVHLSVSAPVRHCECLSICLSICLHISCQSVCLWVCLSLILSCSILHSVLSIFVTLSFPHLDVSHFFNEPDAYRTTRRMTTRKRELQQPSLLPYYQRCNGC